MVKYNASSMNKTLSALSDPTRRAIVERLATGKHSVLQIAKPFKMSLPAVSKHLKVLEKAGLVKREVIGRVHTFNLVAEPMKNAIDKSNQFSCSKKFMKLKVVAMNVITVIKIIGAIVIQ